MDKDTAWWVLSRLNPLRVVYPSFNPTRPREPWVPVPENRTWWERNKPRQARLTTVRSGWPSEPVPALPPSGMKFDPSPGREALVPYAPEDVAYRTKLYDVTPKGRYY